MKRKNDTTLIQIDSLQAILNKANYIEVFDTDIPSSLPEFEESVSLTKWLTTNREVNPYLTHQKINYGQL